MNWFKFYGQDFLTDMKISQLSVAEKLFWVVLLCLAHSEGKGGNISYCTESTLKIKAGIQEGDSEWKELDGVLKLFEKLKMIEFTENGIFVKNFQKRQEMQFTSAEKQARYRERNKVTLVTEGKVTKVTLDKIRLDKIRLDKKEGRFAPPSLEEVRNYCKERENGINAQNFIDFYSSKGWMIGKNKMKDWRAAVRTWEARNPMPPRPTKQLPDKPITPEEIENRKKYLDKIRKNLPLAGVEQPNKVIKKLD